MRLDFGKMEGIIPAIIQDDYTNKVLMLGFMNEEALAATKKTGKVTLYSRTRQELYTKKSEENGHPLEVVSIAADRDADALLIKVSTPPTTCPVNTETCFGEKNKEDIIFLKYLQDFIVRRRQEMPEGSYTTALFNKGLSRIAQKLGEESVEMVIEAMTGDDDRLLHEGSDLLYHLIVLLTYKGYRIEDLVNELKKKHK